MPKFKSTIFIFLFFPLICSADLFARTDYEVADSVQEEICRNRLLKFIETAKFWRHFFGESHYPPSIGYVYHYYKDKGLLVCPLDKKPKSIRGEKSLKTSFQVFNLYQEAKNAKIPENKIPIYFEKANHNGGKRYVLFANFILKPISEESFQDLQKFLKEQIKIAKKNNWKNYIDKKIKATGEKNVQSQFEVAMLYFRGVLEQESDLENAIHWFEQSATAGHVESQYYLSALLRDSKIDQKKSFFWLQKAAENNHPVAQYNLGLTFHEGLSVKKDLKKAMHWYQQSARQGYYGAQYNLGVIYANGEGRIDRVEALKWFILSSMQGYPLATVPLFEMTSPYTDPVKTLKQDLSLQEIIKAEKRAKAYQAKVSPQ